MPMGFCNESCFLNIVQTAHRILWSKSNSQSKHNNWRRKNAAAAACTTSRTKYGSRTGIERIPTLKVRLNLEGFKVNRRLIDFQTNQGGTLNTDHNYNYKSTRYKLKILVVETVNSGIILSNSSLSLKLQRDFGSSIFIIIITIWEVIGTREITDNRHYWKLRI